MSRSLRLSLAIVLTAIVALVAVVVVSNGDSDGQAITDGTVSAQVLVREDSRRLSSGSEAVFVEFLDFECEACEALHPVIEDLRARYGDRVSFVVRYMPLHGNSVNAALAAEAAADQGQFEAMYRHLFATQAEWGHQDASQEERFFTYAAQLGLDMDRFRASYEDPATLARVEQNEQDGRALSVTGTPTFFLDGERLAPESVADLEASLNAALAE